MFWQEPRAVTDARAKARWVRDTEQEFGAWGRVLDDGDQWRGMIQYGPSGAFARARTLPAGPPDRAAALITCAYLLGDDRVGTCERLLLEALADLKGRGLPAVEAFALRYPDEVPAPDRFTAHQTLFDRTFMERFGFMQVRAAGQVSLMRLDLGGLQPEDARDTLLARLVERIRAEVPGDVRPEPV